MLSMQTPMQQCARYQQIRCRGRAGDAFVTSQRVETGAPSRIGSPRGTLF